jgi:3-oxoacyl-[acyl-carrier protein] reductase
MSLAGKVILITGSSNGIGKATAERVAKEGASVVINYFRNADAANAMVQSIGEDRAIAVQADVTKMADNDKLVDAAVAKFGKIDVVVANAADMMMRNVENTTEEDFDSMFTCNVKGPYFLVQVRSSNPYHAGCHAVA